MGLLLGRGIRKASHGIYFGRILQESDHELLLNTLVGSLHLGVGLEYHWTNGALLIALEQFSR